jgi:hypothetical protein
MIPPHSERRTIPEAAAHLAVSTGTVRRWFRDGILAGGERIRPQFIALGGRIYTTTRWLEDFAAAVAAAKTRTPARLDGSRACRVDAVLAAAGW